MPFGVSSAPKEFQRRMHAAFMEWKLLQMTYWLSAVGTLRKSASVTTMLIYSIFSSEHKSKT